MPDLSKYSVTVVTHDGKESPRPVLPRCTVDDRGWANRPRGWFDAQGQGVPNDYCRYIGDGAALYFSCRMANDNTCVDTPPGACEFKAPLVAVCNTQYAHSLAASTAVAPSTRCSGKLFTNDTGLDGNGNFMRGWYDAQCQGRVNDFCRWTGVLPHKRFTCQLSNDCENEYVHCPLVRGVPRCPGYCGV